LTTFRRLLEAGLFAREVTDAMRDVGAKMQ
jgi:hypothetical protein